MEVTVQEKNSYTRVLNFTVGEDKVKEKFDEVMKTYGKTVNIPGFRPGKAPKDMLLKRFGKVMREEAVEMLVSASFKDACENHKLSPISRPVISDLKADEGTALSFKAEIEIEPEVKVTEYKDLGVTVNPTEVKDEEVDKVVEEVRDRLASLEPADRPLKMGDFAEIEYKKVVINNEEKKDYANPRYPVEIGSSTYLKEFEEQLMGLKKGEEKVVTFTFPPDYNHKEVAGQTAAFTVLLKDVKEKVLPELNDEFAKTASSRCKTLSELKEVIRKDLAGQHRMVALDKAYNEAVDKIIAKNPFEVPQSRVEAFLDAAWENFKQRYPESEVTREQFDEKNRASSLREIKRYRILDQVAKAESIKATAEEVDAEIARMAKSRREEFAKVKEQLRKSGRTLEIRERIKDEKTLDFLVGYVRPKDEADGEGDDHDHDHDHGHDE